MKSKRLSLSRSERTLKQRQAANAVPANPDGLICSTQIAGENEASGDESERKGLTVASIR